MNKQTVNQQNKNKQNKTKQKNKIKNKQTNDRTANEETNINYYTLKVTVKHVVYSKYCPKLVYKPKSLVISIF